MGANIPDGVELPASKIIGTFERRAHQVSSGPVTVITDRTIMIADFTYDGFGPGSCLNLFQFVILCLCPFTNL